MDTKENALKYLADLKEKNVKEGKEDQNNDLIHVMRYSFSCSIYSKKNKGYIRFPAIKECLEAGERIQVVRYDGMDITPDIIKRINKKYNTDFNQIY